MANDKKKLKELVSDDDDPTAELETLTFPQDRSKVQSEVDSHTCDFDDVDADPDQHISDLQSDLQDRSATIDRLQFDIEQLRSRWLGLEAEIKAREQLTKTQQQELDEQALQLARSRTELQERDQRIAELESRLAESQQHSEATEAGRQASDRAQLKELKTRLENAEEYADGMRQQLQDLLNIRERSEQTREQLEAQIHEAGKRADELEVELEESNATIESLNEELEGIANLHAEEIRMLRFELGEAQETVSSAELVSEQLASDLLETKGYKDDLEQMLTSNDEKNQQRIEELEKQVSKLQKESEDADRKLKTKSEAIAGLMQELAKKSNQLDSIGEIGEAIHDLEDRMSERIENRSASDRDRVTRLLVGSIDDQELRFPLFKDRLTIGRTAENDIQLKAQHISRRHAVILAGDDATRVIDWGSKNGVFVNAERVTEHFLKNGDIVTIGTADFRYEERAKRDVL
jgi:DNA repair exonuclease SbcCD ATPase subunit